MIVDDVKKFWEDKHILEDVSVLSGCEYNETINFLKLSSYIKPGVTVLEVGVGLGFVTEGLFKNRLRVSALDIADEALDRVKSYCEYTYSVRDITKLPSNYYDIIICNNVVQHIPTEDLILELNEIIRSLKDTGIFAVEFVSNDGFDDNGGSNSVSFDTIRNGGLCRTPKFLEMIINDAGGTCELVFDKKVDINIVKGHHVFHARRSVI